MRVGAYQANAITHNNPNTQDEHTPGYFFIESCNLFQCSDYVNFRLAMVLNGTDKLFITFVKTKNLQKWQIEEVVLGF